QRHQLPSEEHDSRTAAADDCRPSAAAANGDDCRPSAAAARQCAAAAERRLPAAVRRHAATAALATSVELPDQRSSSKVKIRAAVLEEFGQPLNITELDLDEPKDAEVLVRLEACGVC